MFPLCWTFVQVRRAEASGGLHSFFYYKAKCAICHETLACGDSREDCKFNCRIVLPNFGNLCSRSIHIICSLITEDFARIVVNPIFDPFQLSWFQGAEIGSFRQKSAQNTVPILVAPALLTAEGMCVVHFIALCSPFPSKNSEPLSAVMLLNTCVKSPFTRRWARRTACNTSFCVLFLSSILLNGYLYLLNFLCNQPDIQYYALCKLDCL